MVEEPQQALLGHSGSERAADLGLTSVNDPECMRKP